MTDDAARALAPTDPLSAAVLVAKLDLVRIRRGRALWTALGVTAILVVAASLGSLLGDVDGAATFTGATRSLFPFLTMGVALLFATRAVADDVERETIHFFFMLPTPRWSVVLGKYLSAAGVVAAVIVVGVLLLFLGTHLREPSLLVHDLPALGRALAGAAPGALCYTSIFLFLGAAVADLPYLLSLLFVAVVEMGLGFVSLLELVSVRYHLGVLMGVPHEAGLLGTPETPLWVAAVVVGSLTAAGVALTALLAETSEYTVGRA